MLIGVIWVIENLNNLEQLGTGEAFQDELCEMLGEVHLLQGFDGTEIKKLSHYCSAYEAKDGAIIFEEGEKSNFMCLLVEGKVNIRKENKQVAKVRAGKSMGEMSIIDGFPYSATAISAEASKLILFTRRQFERLCDDNPALGLKLYKVISKLMSLRLRQTTGTLIDYL